LAVKEVNGYDQLYLGFRGPVLRGNHALVMVLEFNKGKFKEKAIKQGKKHPKMHYLNLNGRGIRGMTALKSGGFILLAGPVSDALVDDRKSRYQLFYWNGRDDDLSTVARMPLCNVPLPADITAKAEGIGLLNRDETIAGNYRFVVIYDGANSGQPTVFSCKRNG